MSIFPSAADSFFVLTYWQRGQKFLPKFSGGNHDGEIQHFIQFSSVTRGELLSSTNENWYTLLENST